MHKTLSNTLVYSIGALIFIVDAIYNGYPLIYHDLSTYVANGFDLETPIDRPITYCLFVRLFSLNGYSLWSVIFAQAYILSYLVFKLMRVLFTDSINSWYILLLMSILSLFTGVSWTVSQVMPDIFTSTTVIILSILMIGDLSKKEQFLLYFLLLVSTSMHLSHISFNITLILLLTLFKLLNIRAVNSFTSYQRILLFLFITVLGFTTMLSASAKSNHVFFAGAMVEHGIVKEILEDLCESKQYKLCSYEHQIPDRAFQFIWDKNSPLYKIGGWKGAEDELNDIIFVSLTTPKYIFLHIKSSILATIDQLVTFRINDSNGVFLEGTLPYDRMKRYLPGDLENYSRSLQMQNKLGFTDWLNVLYSVIIVISVVLLIWLIIFTKVFRSRLLFVLLLFLMGILINAWISGTFANSINRLGCKMIWLLPFVCMIGLTQYFLDLKLSKK